MTYLLKTDKHPTNLVLYATTINLESDGNYYANCQFNQKTALRFSTKEEANNICEKLNQTNTFFTFKVVKLVKKQILPAVLPPHPTQPLIVDRNGSIKFKANFIVKYLLNKGLKAKLFDHTFLDNPIFTDEDRVQFEQLMGCSFGYWSELDYVSDEMYENVVNSLSYSQANLKAEIG